MSEIDQTFFGVTTGSSDTEILALAPGARHRIQALEIIPLSTGPISVRVRCLSSGSTVGRHLIGSTGQAVTLDRKGLGGQGGFVLPFNERGWATGNVAHSVAINTTSTGIVQYNGTRELIGTST
jgi:hypothetical protein